MPATATPPGPRGHLLYGSLMEFHEDPIAFLTRNAAEHGDTSAFRFFHMPCWQLNHPDDVRRVLVDPEGAFVKGIAMEAFRPLVGKGLLVNEGESHRRQKRLMAPALHRAAVMGYAPHMLAAARALDAAWQDGQRVDMDLAMNRLAVDIAAVTLFGAGLSEQERADVIDAVAGFTRWYHQSTHPLGPLLQALPTAATRDFKEGKAKLSAVIRRIVAARRAGGDAGDILSRLVFARDTEGDGAAMDDSYLHDESVTLLIAGHETTGATLAWALALLAAHPEIADRLAAEVDAATGGRAPEVEDLPRLRYAEWVFHEALRLYPPAVSLPRQVVKPVELGGYVAPRGTLVMVATWCAHHDPRWWEAPEAFRPERWDPAIKAERPRYAYFPFGGGSRACIGETFALVEGTLALATLARRWRARLVEDRAPVPEALFTVRPKGGLPMVLSRR